MSKNRKKQKSSRPELGFLGLALALLALAFVARFLADSRGSSFGATLSLLWVYAGGASFALGVMYFAQFIAPIRSHFGWWEGLGLIIRTYWRATNQFLENPTGTTQKKARQPRKPGSGKIPDSFQTVKAGFVRSHQVLAIMKGTSFIRPAGPGFINLYKREQIRQLIDLRPHIRSQPVHFNTRDGIPIETSVTVVFQVKQAPEAFPDIFLYPYEKDAIFRLSYLNTVDAAGSPQPWPHQLTPHAASLLAQDLVQYDLDDLINVPNTAVSPVHEITQRIRNIIKPEFEAKGINVYAVSAGRLQLPEAVNKQNIDNWRVTWDSKIQQEAAASEAEIVRRMKQARARAQMQIIETIIQNLEAMRQEGESDAYQVIILRLIDALEEAMDSDSPRAFVPQQIMAGLVADTSAQVRAQLDEYFLLPGQEGSHEDEETPEL